MFDEIQTPAVLVDIDVAKRNIARFQAYADSHGLKVRPHIKTHKLPAIAELQLDAGAVGITCQKVSEAEAMVAGSGRLNDVLITYNILGDDKLAALVALARKVKLAVVADSPTVIDGLAAAFASAGVTLDVFVECNTGADRCGVGTPQEAAELAARIAAAPGLHFAGLMTYPPVGGADSVQAFMTEAKALIEARGIAVPAITSGGSPDMMKAHLAPIATEFRPGTYVYNDRSLVTRGVAAWEDCALTVLATVVSVSAPNRAIIDAGSKTLTSDLLGLVGHGHVLGRPDITIDQLSEEHGRLRCDGDINLKVGQRIRIVPNHACVVTNMVDGVHVYGEDKAPELWPVPARGKII
ncbi:D-TA family PLP-dependent enzyme [Aminobacter anthyllidis]|uniref:D-TA family PLP-dependent enzyme n=1 Tax=Aminobacter anthyllidis TaxID=1035067 RepID=A0A9X1A9J1_9HYPH|nr:D-TA family PLP-dependent enzyme [Aminobacter anthyllidis]MBT1155783.1 D-TA family PLP-dependent enzyme [Aminobacter anthyllidis]